MVVVVKFDATVEADVIIVVFSVGKVEFAVGSFVELKLLTVESSFETSVVFLAIKVEFVVGRFVEVKLLTVELYVEIRVVFLTVNVKFVVGRSEEVKLLTVDSYVETFVSVSVEKLVIDRFVDLIISMVDDFAVSEYIVVEGLPSVGVVSTGASIPV